MTLQLRKATRAKSKIRLGLSAVSGGGKTYSAILIGKGLCGDLSKVAIIDTEHGSADLYAHLGDYNVITLNAPFAPERYIEAIKTCEKAGMEVIIIDSISHEWDGEGGCLQIQESLGGKYQDWAKVTPRHQAFINTILQSPCHIITTVRRKQDYEMTKDGNGKMKVEKAGLKEVTREGFEYELTVNLELDTRHNATASKDRTGLFMGKPSFVPSEATGQLILEWCESGKADDIPTRDELDILNRLVSTSNLDDDKKEETREYIYTKINNYKQYEVMQAKLDMVQPNIDEIPNPNQSDINRHVRKIASA
jgi:hypothetical protein